MDIFRGGGQHGDLAAVAAMFDAIAATMRNAEGDGVDPDRLVDVAAAVVPHAEHCGVTLIRSNRRPVTLAASSDLVRRVDEIQYSVGQGPCFDASGGDDYAQVDDLAVDTQWPEFALRSVEQTRIRSMLSVRLLLGGEDRATMNLYASTPAAFDSAALAVASILGPFAGLSVARAIHESDAQSLQQALRTSRQIGRAVGILMAQRQIPSEAALTQLIQSSQHLNRKLRDVAADVERTGSLPEGSQDARSRAGQQ